MSKQEEEKKEAAPLSEEQAAPGAAPENGAANAAEIPVDAGGAGEVFTVSKEQMEKLEGLARELSEQKDQFLRLAAEYDNYRKRTAKEKETIYADAKIDTVTAMLPVYDNLERALAQYRDEDAESPHRKGVEMVFTQFKESLHKLGVTAMDAVGQPFDPEKHNAVMHVEDDSAGENTVVEVLQQGFMLGGKVLRFAIVKVAN